jgi:hypothetical protein
MRIKYGLAVFAALVVGIGVKFYFFSPPIAEAKLALAEAKLTQTDISPRHAAMTATYRQQLKDMVFVYSDAE